MKNQALLISLFLFHFWGYGQENRKLRLDNFLNKIDSSNLLMGNISISKKGEEIYQFSLGYRNLDEKLKNKAQTKFRIGSISKSFTAVMIMQLIEEGKLSLDDKLAKFLPEIPNSKVISIAHLLQHQSGLFNITQSTGFFTWMESFHSQKEVINLIIANGTVFKPGKKTEYSNTNYILLSFILEQIEQKDYSNVLIDRVITPCKLENTYFGSAINTTQNEAFSYNKQNGAWISATMTDMSVPIGAGAIVSTPSDLNSFYFQLFNGKLLGNDILNLMISNNNLYEFALYPVISYDAKRCFGHEGRIDGFHAFATYFPEDNLGISFCSNGQLGYLNEIVLQILDSFHNADTIANTFSQGNQKIELLKISSIVLAKMNDNEYFFLEKARKKVYKSAENKIRIRLNKNNTFTLKKGKEKRTFQKI